MLFPRKNAPKNPKISSSPSIEDDVTDEDIEILFEEMEQYVLGIPLDLVENFKSSENGTNNSSMDLEVNSK
jgi:hypothetical protein